MFQRSSISGGVIVAGEPTRRLSGLGGDAGGRTAGDMSVLVEGLIVDSTSVATVHDPNELES